MVPDPPWTTSLEQATWSQAGPSPVCLTIDQFPQDSCLLGVENPTMVSQTPVILKYTIVSHFISIVVVATVESLNAMSISTAGFSQ